MKTIAKRLIAAITSLAIIIPTASVWAAKGENDVNVAAGKKAISSVYGEGGFGDNVVANVTGDGIFVSCASHEQTELVTVDLGVRYPINEVLVSTYGNNTGTNSANPDDFGFGSDAVFEVYATNTAPDQWTDISQTDGVKLDYIGDTQFVAQSGGGFDSYYELESVGSYRYVQLKYIKGTDAKSDLFLNEIEVYTSQEAASNVPTVVSVGKPVYSQFYDGYNFNILALNDGNFETEHWAYIGAGQFGNGNCGVNSDGTIIDGYYDHIIDLEAKYPIEKVTITKPTNCGTIDGISVSNDPNAASRDWLPLVYDDISDEYYIDPFDAIDFGSEYKFVKIELTPGVWGSDRFVGGIKEVSVYSTSAAAAAADKELVNIAVGKSFTSNEPGAFGNLDDYANDGNMDTYWFTYAGEPQITYDLGRAYTIENVRTYKIGNNPANGNDKGSAITKIEVSNDPNFNSDATVALTGSKYRISNAGNAESNYTSYSQTELPDEFEKYRYVRVTGRPDSVEAWKLDEVEIYTNKEETALMNIAENANAYWMQIDGGGSTYESFVPANATDGDNLTVAISFNGFLVVELPYAARVEQIDISSWNSSGHTTDEFNTAGFNVWLSNANETLSGATAVSTAYDNKVKAGETDVIEVNDENRYSYVIIQGKNGGPIYLSDVKVLTDDDGTVEPEEPVETVIKNELTGEEEKGSVLTLTTSYVSADEINKTLNLFIARYDNGRLTDVEKSGDFAFAGKECSATFNYTITEEVTDQTKFRGFAWDKSTMEPFADSDEIEPYAEYWIDPAAEVNGDGTEASPFNSLRNARDAVRNVIPSMEGDIVINLKDGTYYVDDENYLFLYKTDGGANGHNVIWKNAPGETPVISGGKAVTGFTEGDNGIWYADASEFDSIYGLTVNGEAAKIASTEEPINATKLYGGNTITGEYTDGIGFAKSDLPQISNASNAYVHVASSWVDVMYTVDSVSEDGENYKFVVDSDRLKSSTKKEVFSANNTTIDANDYFYVENALELLDNPGEFYFGDGKLYYMPRTGEDMTTATVEAAVTDYLINISGDRDDHVKNLIISGIRFENTTYGLAYETGFTTGQAQVMNLDYDRFIEGSIWVNYADNIEISDCEFTGIDKPCISFVEGVLDSTITRNKFYNIGGSAVAVGTNQHHELEYTGEERCERNTISDNVIENPAMKFRGSPAIACYYVVDTDIVHNKMTNCNYSGISLGWGWNDNPDLTVCTDNTVANNYIENVNLIAADGGAVYTLGKLPNAVIEGNYYVQTKMPQQTSGTIGIYFDEGTQDVTATNNVIDMIGISDYSGDIFAIRAWTNTIKNVTATGNYATLTAVENSGTSCTIDTPTSYTAGSEPAAVQNIIDASAISLK